MPNMKRLERRAARKVAGMELCTAIEWMMRYLNTYKEHLTDDEDASFRLAMQRCLDVTDSLGATDSKAAANG